MWNMNFFVNNHLIMEVFISRNKIVLLFQKNIVWLRVFHFMESCCYSCKFPNIEIIKKSSDKIIDFTLP